MNPPAALAAFAQLKAGAAARGTDIEVMTAVAEGAFAAGNAGDSATHDRLVIEAVERTAGMVDVICLAQAPWPCSGPGRRPNRPFPS